MKSIYRDIEWLYLQEEKEGGEAIIFETDFMYYPFIKRKAGIVDGIQYYDITTPRGQGGPMFKESVLLKKENMITEFMELFTNYCLEQNIIAEYAKLDPWEDISEYFVNWYDELDEHGKLYCNNLQIDYFNEEYASTKRKNIRKAEKSGLAYTYDTQGKDIDILLECYKYTENKNSISQYYEVDRTLIEKYFATYPGRVLITTVYLNEIVLGCALTVWSDDIAHHIYGGYAPEYNTYQASSYIVYCAQKFVKEKGCKIFDQGGATPSSNLEEFKDKFVKKSKPYIYKLGKKIYNPIIYQKLIEIYGRAKTGYFPEYNRQEN